MKSSKRDLLVLSRKASTDQRGLELEIEMLHNLLFTAESIENFCIANEIIDINRYKVICEPLKIQKIISKNRIKAFQFINNKN
jgi:hypothetical protein